MKIILNCLSHAWGGRETCFFDDITEFKKHGYDMIGIVYKNSPISRKLKEKYPEIPIEEIDSIGFKYFNPFLIRKYYGIIKKHNPDIIHSHDIWTLYTLLLTMRFFPKIPLIATEHLFIEHKKTGFYRKFLYKRLDTMVAISKAMVPNVLEMYPLKNSQVKPIYGGFAYSDASEESIQDTTRDDLNIPKDALVIGMIGRIDPAKGQLELVKAYAELSQKYPDKDIHLLIAGRPTLNKPLSMSYKAELDDLIQKNNLQDKVKQLGFVNSVPNFLSLLDVFVMPSYYEAFGLVLIQAMSKGLPLIATDAGSAREIINLGKNGYVYPQGDHHELSDRLDKILFVDDSQKMKEESFKRFDEVFKYEHHLNNIVDLYKDKISERKNF